MAYVIVVSKYDKDFFLNPHQNLVDHLSEAKIFYSIEEAHRWDIEKCLKIRYRADSINIHLVKTEFHTEYDIVEGKI